MLVLEPIFEAHLPPEQYAYRPGRNAQQAVVEVQGLLFRGHLEVVKAEEALQRLRESSRSTTLGVSPLHRRQVAEQAPTRGGP
jgi:hypothetical protein